MGIPPLGNTPPEVLATIPLAPPPPGVTPNFANPASRAPEVLGVGFTLMGIATLCFFLRLYTRAWILKKWKIEDTTLTLGFIVGTIYWAGQVHGCLRGAFGRHAYEIHLSSLFFPGWFFVNWCQNCLPLLPFGLIKMTILLQYWALFSVKKWMRICIYIGMGVIIPFYFLLTIVLIIFGSPWPGESYMNIYQNTHANWIGYFIKPSGVIGVVVDFYLLLIPLPAVFNLNMSRGKKFGVAAIFMTGILACVASIIGCAARFRVSMDPFWDGAWSTLWVAAEFWVGVIVASMPAIHQFWNRHSQLVWLSDKVKLSLSQLVNRSGSRTKNQKTPPPKLDRSSSEISRGSDAAPNNTFDLEGQTGLPIQQQSRMDESYYEPEKKLPIQMP